MTPDKPNPASAAARTGSGKHHKRLASDFPGFKLPAHHAQAQSQLRRQRLVEHLHRLGPSPLGHFIREVEDAARVDVTPRLERYAEIDPEFLRALGGDKFPPRFLHALDDEGSEP